jgi:hypothetical protein
MAFIASTGASNPEQSVPIFITMSKGGGANECF